jgi:hypothetical protein
MAALKTLMSVYILLMALCLLAAPFAFLFFYFTLVSCIAGIIPFVYLCRARRLVISSEIFFLLPHILLFLLFGHDIEVPMRKGQWSYYDTLNVYYLIAAFGLPFLLYCFLQITEGRFAVIARIFCFILPLFFLASAGYIGQ